MSDEPEMSDEELAKARSILARAAIKARWAKTPKAKREEISRKLHAAKAEKKAREEEQRRAAEAKKKPAKRRSRKRE